MDMQWRGLTNKCSRVIKLYNGNLGWCEAKIFLFVNLTTDYSDDDRGGMAAAPIDGDCGFEAMETHFEGIFQAGGHQEEGGGAWGNTDPYYGVEPMG